MRLRTLFEADDDMELADDVVIALRDAGVTPEILDGGDNFNVSFDLGDDTYYVRPNDKGSELFYISADKDDSYDVKIKDLTALKKHVKGMDK